MAATPFDPSLRGSPLFDIYHDSSLAAPGPALALPGGACNFVDLTPGANGARCGCRRFWMRQVAGSPGPDPSGWCMCNHHACYHEAGGNQGQALNTEVQAAGQENERPRTGREPLSPVLDMPHMVPPAIPGMDFSNFGQEVSLSFIHDHPDVNVPDRPGVPSSLPVVSSIPDTLNWCDFGQSQSGRASNYPNTTLPPIPSQCLMPSQTASTTSSVQAKYFRPFAGKGLQTLTSTNAADQSIPQQADRPKRSSPSTPPRDPRTMEDSFIFVSPDVRQDGTPRSGTATQAEPRVSAAAVSPNPGAMARETLRNLTDTVSGHEQRLDRLETSSFSALGHDECNDKYDQLDLRATDLEHRMEEVEKLVNDNGSVVGRYPDKNDDLSAQSVVSALISGTSRPTYSQDFQSQILNLQAQVTQLQSSLPSYNRPWEVEVVFLPFPLKKLWQEAHQFKSDPLASSDDWTQLPLTNSTGTLRSQSPHMGDWVGPERDTEWLLPRACGDKSVPDKRLRSRGLVQTVSVKGPDARSVQMAVNLAFGSVFRDMRLGESPELADTQLSMFLGLKSAWVPLRKIHKDSRLRFLSPPEMLTPALWDVQFLNSVMMKSSEPRLFITHPDAYLQNYDAYEAGWNWHQLRELTRIYPDITESQEVPEADAMEECWAWNELLDEPSSDLATMNRCQGIRHPSVSQNERGFAVPGSERRPSSVVSRGSSAMLPGRRRSRPPHIRTTSVPLAPAARSSPTVSKRRILSHGQSGRSSPSLWATSQSALLRRRRTRSPSHPRFTPRWTASPSPGPFGLQERQIRRGTTPIAYATPYSNAPLQDVPPMRGGSVSRNAPQEYDNDYQARLDELYDIEIYESASDNHFDDGDEDASTGSVEIVTHAQPGSIHESQPHRQLPEDEPWPGIEEQDPMSDGENVDPQAGDRLSDFSSQPSEYPSTQRAWPENNVAFQIHEDEDMTGHGDD